MSINAILIKYFNCIHIYIVKFFIYFTFMIVENASMVDSDSVKKRLIFFKGNVIECHRNTF